MKLQSSIIQKSGNIQIEFPTWDHLIADTLTNYFWIHKVSHIEPQDALEDLIHRLQSLKGVLDNFHPSTVLEFVASSIPEIDEKLNQDYIDSVLKHLGEDWKGVNEFYVLFDIKKCEYVYVDERIRDVLGIEPEMFNIRSISALDDCHLYHPDDISHMIRFALLALMSISLPFLEMNEFKEHYIARYRLGTTMSKIPNLRKKGYVVINKMCYVLYHPSDKQPSIPRYHVDRYYVFTDDEIEHPSRTFVSNYEQTILLNKLQYLMNAFLIDMPSRYVCMLEERRTRDRNKAVANAMNEQVRLVTGNMGNFDELQVANCFAKTIRAKIEQAMYTSDRYFNSADTRIESDQDAVFYATRMGLLPLPENLKDTIYRNIRNIF